MQTRSLNRFAVAALAAAAAFLLLAHGGADLHALQRMAGYAGKGSMFKDANDYLNGLRDSLIPLAIPLGAIGLTGGGVAYMVGNAMAQKILGGVVIGSRAGAGGPSIAA